MTASRRGKAQGTLLKVAEKSESKILDVHSIASGLKKTPTISVSPDSLAPLWYCANRVATGCRAV